MKKTAQNRSEKDKIAIPKSGEHSQTAAYDVWVNDLGVHIEARKDPDEEAAKSEVAADRIAKLPVDVPWCDVNTAEWDGARLVISLVDPDSALLRLKLQPAPDWRYMELIRQSLTHAVVLSNTLQLENGTLVSASVRRAPDGELFSVVVAHGEVPSTALAAITDLEERTREAAGLPSFNQEREMP